MSFVAETAPQGRVPRHVWALILVAVLVLGFALGGALRTAIAAGSGSGPWRPPGTDLLGSAAGGHPPVVQQAVARAPATAAAR